MSFRIKNCISARSDNTSVAGLVKSHNHKFKMDPIKDESLRESNDVLSRIFTLEKTQCEMENTSRKPCIIHEFISERIKTLEDKVLCENIDHEAIDDHKPTNLQPILERVNRLESMINPIQSSISKLHI